MKHDLTSFVLKLNRALDHLDALNEAVERFDEGDLYTPFIELDRQRRAVVRVKNITEPPPEWSVLIGDCVYNMRSALDHLAYQLAVVHTGHPLPPQIEKSSAFPIFNSGPHFRRRNRKGHPTVTSGLHKIRGVAPKAQAAIERLQPYHRRKHPSNELLWVLEELSNVDKHRLPHVAAHVLKSSRYRIESAAIERLLQTETFSRRLKDNAMLARFTVVWSSPHPQVDVNLHLATEIEFDRRSPAKPVRGRPVIETLSAIHDFIFEDVLLPLAPFLNVQIEPAS